MSKVISHKDTDELERWQQTPVETKPSATARSSMMTASQLEEIQKQAHTEGYEAGYREGLTKGENEVKLQVQRVVKILNTLSEPLQELDDTVEQELVTLSLTIAKQIIRRELKVDPSHVVGIVKAALACLPLAARTVHIRLHPNDAELVSKIISTDGKQNSWQIVDDPGLNCGDCRITTETSQIDATLDKRLATIASQLFGGEREGEVHSEN